ncbi:hypothetical protein G7B40_031235 [Aetokthonos hydrillicola Thurmond2011]|uniref:Uncharacterized protein n=1 Tax=Aetokthonos hydrillicola Thurmond2011 TaxID=2712845 RepID=A0AAP5MD94_9CYAN|nr:hypothetical protein [Aetokthonos hydrillicola CCALA 1050]MDR9898999.1 hypothetical protein [Aetokthonos hydrillicola Thurmond2011]
MSTLDTSHDRQSSKVGKTEKTEPPVSKSSLRCNENIRKIAHSVPEATLDSQWRVAGINWAAVSCHKRSPP